MERSEMIKEIAELMERMTETEKTAVICFAAKLYSEQNQEPDGSCHRPSVKIGQKAVRRMKIE